MERTVVIGTWAFSAEPVTVAARLAREGGACEECLEKALNMAEEDERYGPCQVGRGGPPNEKGEVELDAAMMSGLSLNFGAVTALQRVSRASSVARCVMERSRHSMLTGQGAQDFAVQCGFHLDSPRTQSGDGDREMCVSVERQDKMGDTTGQNHDTLGLIVLDSQGHIAAGVTTSGMKAKARGRIGDSALPGSGLYADNEVGAVCCSGDGDQIMKFCPSFMVMEFMRQGLTPEAACEGAVRRINKRLAPCPPFELAIIAANMKVETYCPPFELAIIAANMKGEVGGATTVREWTDPLTGHVYPGFPMAVCGGGTQPEIRVVPPVP